MPDTWLIPVSPPAGVIAAVDPLARDTAESDLLSALDRAVAHARKTLTAQQVAHMLSDAADRMWRAVR